MNTSWAFILSMSCVIPLLAGIWKWSTIKKAYYPFIILMLAAFLTELIVGIADFKFANNTIYIPVYNLYSLEEYILYMMLFKNCSIINKKGFIALIVFGFIVQLLELLFVQKGNFLLMFLKHFSFYTQTILSLVIFFLSVKQLSLQIFKNVSFATNAENFIAMGTLLMKGYIIFAFSFRVIRISTLSAVLSYDIFRFINPVCYLIFTWAILCIPHKQKY
jgi:hypothetical protein